MNIKSKYIAWILVVGWMGCIFYLSHQPASSSSELSTGIMSFLLSIIKWLPFQFDQTIVHFFIRKGAHFFAYLILGMLVCHALNINRFRFFVALTICIVYAITDEVHQLFIEGRSGEVRDVVIDSFGSIVGIVVYLFVKKLKNKVE